MRYLSGEIDEIANRSMRVEVKRALWVPLADATRQMAYSGERKVVIQAQQHLAEHGLSSKPEKERAAARKSAA